MVSEGALNWSLKPWLRRLVTRSISITPSIIIAGAVGREGLSAALNGTQVVLSVVLPFVCAPLIWFTCRGRYMRVESSSGLDPSDEAGESGGGHGPDLRIGDGQSVENAIGIEVDAEKGNSDNADTEPTSTRLISSDNTTATTTPLVPNIAFSAKELEAGTLNLANRNRNGNRNRNRNIKGSRNGNGVQEAQNENSIIEMGNHWVTTVFAILIWIIIAVMNVANLVLLKNQ